MSEERKEFSYILVGNDAVVIANLTGELQARAAPAVETFKDEILGRDAARVVILNFSEVTAINGDVIPCVAQLLKSVRSKPAELRLCSLSPEVKDKLNRYGLLRSIEVAEDIKRAIHSIRPVRAA
ncbi:MAG: STAS domain-containing protein [Bdellovibrionales bacterium]